MCVWVQVTRAAGGKIGEQRPASFPVATKGDDGAKERRRTEASLLFSRQ